VVVANLIGYYLVNRIYKSFSPMCFDDIENSAKSSSLIMNRIGGYSSKYAEIELENYSDGKPADFELRILGKTSIVTFTGSVQKNSDVCRILKIDTTYTKYETQ
jgi:hypothetical protein